MALERYVRMVYIVVRGTVMTRSEAISRAQELLSEIGNGTGKEELLGFRCRIGGDMIPELIRIRRRLSCRTILSCITKVFHTENEAEALDIYITLFECGGWS